VAVRFGDESNIRATLPVLFPEQQQDVLFAERRFAKPEGAGVLFTNGTGTGKTFTGLGIARRYERAGKPNILIVVPGDGVAQQWIEKARLLGLDVQKIADTKSAGEPGTQVVTSYANLYQNSELPKRKWDLVITDESHKLMSAKDGEDTVYLDALRAITLHPDGGRDRARLIHKELYEEIIENKKLEEAYRAKIDDDPSFTKLANDAHDAWRKALDRFTELEKPILEEVRQTKPEDRTRVVFLSATPFAYRKSVRYGQGYLFDWNKGFTERHGYNAPSADEQFFITHFGYRMRYGKLTEPEADVDTDIMEQNFNEWLQREQVLSGRQLEIDADYERKFILIDDALGNKIDEGLQYLAEAGDGKYRPLWSQFQENFNYLRRMFLLEALKAKHSVRVIREHMALGRKVVVFHDYNKGGATHPFKFSKNDSEVIYSLRGGTKVETTIRALVEDFERERADLMKLDFSGLTAPIVTLEREFPEAVFYNGTRTKKENSQNIKLFKANNFEHPLIVIQGDKGKEGIDLQDTDGNYMRVMINLGMPVKPTTAIQEEGRTYRVGNVSDALFLYMNTGTNWERWTFGSIISQRSETAENLALGTRSRMLRQSFIDAFEESVGDYHPAAGEGKGGKERDRRTTRVITEYERARTYYFGKQRRTSREKSREGTDFFATPEPIGFKMVEWLDPKPNEKLLEPSAGDGAVARFFPPDTHRTAIEPSFELTTRLGLVTDAKIIQGTFEDHNLVNKYHGIATNPPFGVGAKTAIEHLAKDVLHLYDGGRISILLPEGSAAETRFNKFMYGDKDGGAETPEKGVKDVYVVADIRLPSVTFERAGTKIRSHVVVLEKQKDPARAARLTQTRRDLSDVDDINELFDRLEHLSIPPRIEVPTNENGVPVTETPAANAATSSKGGSAPAGDLSAGDLEAAQFTHTRSGQVMYVAKMAQRLSDVRYQNLKALARRPEFDGYYSSYKAGGAVPGFLFKTKEQRDLFMATATAAQPEMERAYHGSPHKFDNFRLDEDTSRSGEGHNSYGYGLYFAGAKAVAEHYRRGLSQRDLINKARDAYDEDYDPGEAVEELLAIPGLNENQRELIEALSADGWLGFDYPHQAIAAAFREPEQFDLSDRTKEALAKQGAIYAVDLKPEEDEYLLWDKPLNAQSEKVKAALRSMGVEVSEIRGTDKQLHENGRRYFYSQQAQADADEDIGIRAMLRAALIAWQQGPEYFAKYLRSMSDGYTKQRIMGSYYSGGDKTGETYYRELQYSDADPAEVPAPGWGNVREPVGDRAASMRLLAHGIRGIKYLDGFSRSKGDGTYNYVIFDDKDVSIDEIALAHGEAPRGWTTADSELTTPDIESLPAVVSFRRPTKGAPEGYIVANVRTIGLISSLFGRENVAGVGGMNLPPATARAAVGQLQALADSIRSGAKGRELAAQLLTIRGAIQEALAVSGDGQVQFINPVGKSLRELKALRRHESTHASGRRAASGANVGDQVDTELFAAHPLYPRVRAGLLNKGYRDDVGVMASEAASYIASGESYKIGLTRDEGKELIKHYWNLMAMRWGSDALEAFDKIAPQMVEVRDEAKRRAAEREAAGREGAGEGAGRQGRASTPSRVFEEPGGARSPVRQDEQGRTTQAELERSPAAIKYHATESSEDFQEFAPFTHFGSLKAAHERLNDLVNEIGDSALSEEDENGDEYEVPERGRIIPVYLSIKNPLYVEDKGQVSWHQAIGEAAKAAGAAPGSVDRAVAALEEDNNPAPLVRVIERLGYDGIEYKNIFEDAGSTSWMNLRPSQVRSAISNTPELARDRRGERGAVTIELSRGPLNNYSGFGAVKNVLVRNLSQLEDADVGAHAATVRAAGSRAQSAVIFRGAVVKIVDALGRRADWDAFRSALVESRLRGIRERWLHMAEEVQGMDDDTLRVEMRRRFTPLLEHVGRNAAFDELTATVNMPLHEHAGALLFSEAFDGLRDFLEEVFVLAAMNVASVRVGGADDGFEALTETKEFQEALRVYKELIERPMAESHARNEGVFSDALGPLETYYPLIPLNEDGTPKRQAAGNRFDKYRKPKNLHNRFATGLAERYDLTAGALADDVARAFKANNVAAMLDALEAAGLVRTLGRKEPEGNVITVHGREYRATVVRVTPDREIVKEGGRRAFVPARKMLVPVWLRKELKPILEGEFNPSTGIAIINALNRFGMQGPLDAIFHSTNVIGALVAGTPWAGTDLVSKTIGNTPVTKLITTVVNLVRTNPLTEAALRDLKEMAELGLLPDKYGSETYSKRYRDLTGAARKTIGPIPYSFGPFLYGPKGLDVRARLLMYRIAKQINPNATAADLTKFVGQLGNYTRGLQGAIERAVKDKGFAPFYTAGSTMLRNGVSVWLGLTPLPGGSGGGRVPPGSGHSTAAGAADDGGADFDGLPPSRLSKRQRLGYMLAQQLSAGAIGLLALWILAYKAYRDKYPWEEKQSRLLQIPLRDEHRHTELGNRIYGINDKPGYVNMGFFSPIVERGARALGLLGAWDVMQAGGSGGQMMERAERDALNSAIHPFTSGPVTHAALVGLTGREPYLQSLRDPYGRFGWQFRPAITKAEPGPSTAYQRAKETLLSLNSFYQDVAANAGIGSQHDFERDQDTDRNWTRMVLDLAFPRAFKGPYDVGTLSEQLAKERKSFNPDVLKQFQTRDVSDALRFYLRQDENTQAQLREALIGKISRAKPGSLDRADLEKIKKAGVPEVEQIVTQRAPVEQELERLGVKFPQVDRDITAGGDKRRLSDEELDGYRSRFNSLVYERLPGLLTSQTYAVAPNDRKRLLIAGVIENARETAVTELRVTLNPADRVDRLQMQRQQLKDKIRGTDYETLGNETELQEKQKDLRRQIRTRP
jgi:hypothetical protein